MKAGYGHATVDIDDTVKRVAEARNAPGAAPISNPSHNQQEVQ